MKILISNDDGVFAQGILAAKQAVEEKNHKSFISNNRIMSEHFFKKENFRQMLEYVLKVFCMNINPIWKIDDLKEHVGVYMDVYNDLGLLKEELPFPATTLCRNLWAQCARQLKITI